MSRNAPKCILGIVVVAVFFGLTWSTTAARLTLTTTGSAVNPAAARASFPAKLVSSRPPLALTASPTTATVTTDKSDYVPGETVHVTGTGWQSGETVRLDFDENPSICPHRTFTSVADNQGNITNDELVLESHDRGLTITLTATGLSSNQTATTSFTDAPLVVDFKQGANNDSTGSGLCTPLPNCEHWIGSIVQASNAIYFEGMTNPQRVGLINMNSTTSHTLTFRHEFTKGGIHAYDFLTGYYDAQNIVPAMPTGPFSPPLALNVCGQDIGPPAGTGALCDTLHTGVPAYGTAPGNCTVPNVFGAKFVDLEIPDDGTTPIVDPTDGALCPRIKAYELATGCNRTIRIISNQIITGATLTYVLSGDPSGDSDLAYTLTWTTAAASTQAIIEMGGHLAKTGDPGALAACGGPAQADDIAWGLGQGSSQISGGPYHFNLDLLDSGSLGSQDNQIKGADIQVVCPTCSVSGPTGPVCPGTSQDFTLQVGVCENQTISWTFVSNTSGATFTSATNGPTVTVNSGTSCGSYTVRATVTCTGCTATTCDATVSVQDTEPPTIGGQGPNGTIECPGTPSFTPPTASDNCGGATVHLLSDTTAAGTCANTFSRTRTWDATDVCGNHSSTVSQTISVVDTTPPTIGSPGPNGTVECPGTPSFTPPTVSDTCSGASLEVVSDTTAAGSCAGTRSETKTWRAVDGCGNHSGNVSQTISVVDTTPPTIGSPGPNGTVECGTPSFTPPTVSDTCSGASLEVVSDTTAAGSCAGTFSETKTWRAVDGCGNHSGNVSQTISVVDTTPPTIGSPGPNGTVECPGTPSFTPPTVSDTCSGASLEVVSDTTAAGSCAGTRSETKTWRAVDGCGNHSGNVSQTISVVDTTPPTIGSPGPNGTVECPGTPSFTPPTVSDTCSGASLEQVSDTTAAGSCAGTFSETKTWRAVDGCGNHSGNVSQTISVVDTTPPTIGTPGPNGSVSCPNTPVFTPPTVSDTCSGASLQLVSDTTAGSICAGTFSETRTWRARDGCGNTSGTVSQTILVVDSNPASCSIDPPANPPDCGSMHNTLTSHTTNAVSCLWSLNQAAIDAGWAIESSNCNGVTYTAGADMATVAHFTLTVTDACGCQSTCSLELSCLPPEMEFCTLTQGAYGNSKGRFNGIQRTQLIKNLLAACGPITLGKAGDRFITFTTDPRNANCIISVMPAGGTPDALPPGTMITINGTNCSDLGPLLNNGRFNNVLIGQVLALTLNLCLDAGHGGGNGNCAPHSHDLGNLALCTLLVTRPASPGPDGCLGNDNDVATGSPQNFLIPMSVLCALQNLGFPNTVNGLLQLANCALAGQPTGGATLAEINQAVDAINEGFDGCRFLINHCDDRLECSQGSLVAPSNSLLALERPWFPFASNQGSTNFLSWLNLDRYRSGRLALLVDAETNPRYFRFGF